MAATTRLLVLGALRETGPVHGYDLRRELLSWGAAEWANVAPGSIYNALKSLEKEELLEIVGTDRQGARPERTTYRLTDAGEAEFQRLLRENLWDTRVPNHPLLIGLAFFPHLPADELAAAMRRRAEELRARAESIRDGVRSILAGGPIPRHVAESYRFEAAQLDGEATWAAEFAGRLENGDYA
ncbi:PadR family transcriptional regulator [Amycolatopsis magusensis]|uniref:PadR family transcriptional regulator n=1 Tax=Amycolatopsis magusensis TaxID=882444 RepID=UPI003790B02E